MDGPARAVAMYISRHHTKDSYGLELVVDNNTVYVVKGKVRARLEPGSGIESAKLVGTQVDAIVDQLSCDVMTTAPSHWQVDQLEARLANVVAYGQHTKGPRPFPG